MGRNVIPLKITDPVIFLVILLVFTGCASSKFTGYTPEQKLAPGKLQEDLQIMQDILETRHPALYLFTPKDSLAIYFRDVKASLADSMTEFDFRKKIAWYISKIKSGHTIVRPSKHYAHYAETHENTRFPLFLKAWKDSLAVTFNMLKKDTVLKRGTIITSINGHPNQYTIDSIFQFLTSDGNALNFKYRMLSNNFPLYYSFAFPVGDFFTIGYLDSIGQPHTIIIPAYKPIKDTTQPGKGKPREIKKKKRSAKERKQRALFFKRDFVIDSSLNTAYLRVSSFSRSHLRPFFRRSFKKINALKISNLVIDVRDNTGGRVSQSILLSKYLVQQPFTFADTVTAVTHTLRFNKYLSPPILYDIATLFTSRKKEDGLYHFSYFENHPFRPYNRKGFKGNIYILQNGFTFSAGALFVAQLKGQSNVTVIGEESGGGNEGTSAIYLPEIILPNSKLRITLPFFRIHTNRSAPIQGKGVLPDIEVLPTSAGLRNGIDPVIQKVKEIISGKSSGKY